MCDGSLCILLETEESPITFASHDSSNRKGARLASFTSYPKRDGPLHFISGGPPLIYTFLAGIGGGM
jgi:hypothetical protein